MTLTEAIEHFENEICKNDELLDRFIGIRLCDTVITLEMLTSGDWGTTFEIRDAGAHRSDSWNNRIEQIKGREDMTTLTEFIARIEEYTSKATKGPWIWGSWTIHDSDRAAQKRREPYWTLTDDRYGQMDLCKGPVGRKSLDTEYIVKGSGYECDGIDVSEHDAKFIASARTDIEKLVKLVRNMDTALNECKEDLDMVYFMVDYCMKECEEILNEK